MHHIKGMSIFNTCIDERFEEIVCGSLPFFRRIAMRILANAEDADDAVQNACAKGWSRRFLIRDSGKMRAWLARIVVNESYSLLRSRRRSGKATRMAIHDAAARDAVDEEQYMKLEAAIERLPGLYRETVHIAVLGGIGTEEACNLLQCTPNTLYQRIYKSKQILKRAMENE